MSETIARVYTNTSRRANRKQPGDHKVVYRSVLGNPFHVDCVTLEKARYTFRPATKHLDSIDCSVRWGAAHYQLVRDARKKKGITASSSHKPTENHVGEPNQELLRLSTSAPPIIQHITVGINEVTKAFEKEIRSSRPTVVIPSSAVNETQSLTRVVFICYADLDTPAFVAHLPQLVALCNSARSEHHTIKVVQLPAGAQVSIANSLGYLKDLTPGLGQLEPLLAAVPDPPASWMASMQGVALEPSHVKQLLTTAPQDMKAAKERRAKGRAAAKERNKTRSRLRHGYTGT
ncbi:hypothetical protein BJV77DRAFT_1063115 [Russula vinacea]|nr:hypothetical protein BJV77DRAFT_1063115 [Russula vinacea]